MTRKMILSQAEIADYWNRLLLRARRERPRRRRAAEHRYERAAPHSITSSASSTNESGSVSPIALAALRLTINS